MSDKKPIAPTAATAEDISLREAIRHACQIVPGDPRDWTPELWAASGVDMRRTHEEASDA